ncbi:MAG: sulfatase [Gemmatimonadales bacterium]
MTTSGDAPPGWRRLAILGIWAGLATGLAEIVLVQIALRTGAQVRLSGDYVWMAPVADVSYALAALGALLVIARWRRQWDPTPTVLATLAALFVVSVAFYLENLHRGAVLLLAAGIGAQVGRLARYPRARRLYRLVPITGLLMIGLIGYQGARLRLGAARHEATQLATLPASPTGPNVLLLILDTARRNTNWATGARSTTPTIDSLARRGVSFERAVAPAPWTLPSHASFFTGRLPNELSASLSAPLDDRYPTLAEYLAGRGYLTAGFVANLAFATRASGLGRGFVHYSDYPTSTGQILISSSIGRAVLGAGWIRRLVSDHDLPNRRKAGEVAADFLAWQRDHPGQPFFAFVNFFEAHEPHFPPGRPGSLPYEHVVGLFAGANAEVFEKWNLSPEQVKVHAEGYFHAVSEADAAAGRLFAEMERRGILANTVVIIAADHGELLGEHQRFGHLNSLYLPALHVPLAMFGPGVPAGRQVAEAVTLRDLPATVVDLLGQAVGAPFPGRSLASRWTDTATTDTVFSMLQGGYERQARYPIGRGKAMYSLTTTEHQYIRNADQSEELYDLGRDPNQAVNLARAAVGVPELAVLRQGLDRLLATTPAASGGRHAIR